MSEANSTSEALGEAAQALAEAASSEAHEETVDNASDASAETVVMTIAAAEAATALAETQAADAALNAARRMEDHEESVRWHENQIADLRTELSNQSQQIAMLLPLVEQLTAMQAAIALLTQQPSSSETPEALTEIQPQNAEDENPEAGTEQSKHRRKRWI